MDAIEQTSPATYELPMLERGLVAPAEPPEAEAGALPEPLLLQNVKWFCQLRWAVTCSLTLLGIAGFFPEMLAKVGLEVPVRWPFVMAGVLAFFNVLFLIHARGLAGDTSKRAAMTSLWFQIILDLIVLTGVVHHVGSLETYIACAYLFHIVLACIFLSARQSFSVMAMASGMYVLCVLLEERGFIPNSSIYADHGLRKHIASLPGEGMFRVASLLAILFVVWYLTSHLSGLVRDRDRRLADTNERLALTQQEKTSHMLRTTHELKAPFAAIHANSQLLLKGYCGELPDEALDVIMKISSRCRRLASQIQDMLQLANLNSISRDSLDWAELDLAEVLTWCVKQALPMAEERRISIQTDIQPAMARGVEDHVKMCLSNLIANACSYSREGGCVEVKCSPRHGGGAIVTVQDNGIGIARDKLPHIFDEYYRTEEAVMHNKDSTGLGLAIVRHVARSHNLRIQVDSEPAKGTRFTVEFRSRQRLGNVSKTQMEV